MKNIYGFFVLFVLFGAMSVDAQIALTVNGGETTFNTSVVDISKVSQIDSIKFSVGVEDIINPSAIAYWKVRSYCEEDMTIQLTASSTNDCGKAVRFNSLDNNSFAFLFHNNTNQLKNFAVKLKAYDVNGKWLHTEREGFRWR